MQKERKETGAAAQKSGGVSGYVVADGRQVQHDGTLYEGGDSVELSASDAQPLISLGFITPATPATPAQAAKEGA